MRNTKILVISFVAACILFVILTVVQNALTHYEPKESVFIARTDVLCDTELSVELFEEMEVPLSLAVKGKPVLDLTDFEGKYAQNPIYQGQILFQSDVAESKRISATSIVEGREKVAIKLKSSENAVSYQLEPGCRIHLYFTGRYGAVRDILQSYGLQNDAFDENSNYTVKLLKDEEVLGIFDETGISSFSEMFTKPDTIVLSVDSHMAHLINNLRLQGVFDVTL